MLVLSICTNMVYRRDEKNEEAVRPRARQSAFPALIRILYNFSVFPNSDDSFSFVRTLAHLEFLLPFEIKCPENENFVLASPVFAT